jgi:cellulose synthase/poly-beta-1,6-N-acetylglucosamine synthase-like glycosyltransferase
LETLFLVSLFIIFYTYVGYGILLYLIVRVLRWFRRPPAIVSKEPFTPSLTLIVAAYNEARFIEEKIRNTLSLQYPKDKIRFIFITDGSTDATPEIIVRYPEIELMHKTGRTGKIVAVHRAMTEVVSEIVVFTDANTMINADALLHISRHYRDEKVGAVAGEKRVQIDASADATAGEGFYWKYESALKKWDSELYSVVGAAGELFSIRSALYEPVSPDTLLDDFMISMNIALKGYRIIYEPEAYAIETASANTTEELKRKIRIGAGGIQSIVRLKRLLWPFSFPLLSFEYLSHRLLRWIITPYLMILAFILNIFLLARQNNTDYLIWLMAGQVLFYGASLLGWLFEKRRIKIKIFFVPYYFCLMNYAVIAGMIRFVFTEQTVLWEKAKRK